MGSILDGKVIAAKIQNDLKQQISSLKTPPCLAMVIVGDHAPSQIYVRRKAEACEKIGMRSIRKTLPASTSEATLLQLIDQLNADSNIHGILIQLPLPPQINPYHAICKLAPHKDVDGLHPLNAGKLLLGNTDGFIPCTPLGIKTLLQHASIDISGKQVAIMGRSNLVGKPLAALLMQNAPGANATVTILHSQSLDIPKITSQADILIVAMGKPESVHADMIKENAIVIDVGINKVNDKIVGDVHFDSVLPKCSLITPVPGGIGPMTIAMLLSNTLKAYLRDSVP